MMKFAGVCFLALILGAAASELEFGTRREKACQHGQSLGSAKRALSAQKAAFARKLKAVRQASKAKAKVGGAPVEPAGPGAGADMGALTPYDTIYKDGYFSLGCKRDDMYFSADKHSDQGGHRYAAGWADVSIIWYHEMITEPEDREPMTQDVCYDFCRTIPQMNYFGLMAGRECYCTPYYKEGSGGEEGSCDMPCEGNAGEMCGGQGKSNLYEMHLCDDTAEDMAAAMDKADAAHTLADGAATAGADAADKMTKLGDELETEASLAGDATAVAHAKAAKVYGGEVERASDAARKAADALDAIMKEAPAEGATFTAAADIRKAESVMDDLAPATKAADEAGDASANQNALAVPPVSAEGKDLDGYYTVTYFVARDFESSMSTCAGTPTRKPAVGLSKEQCAAACEAAVFPATQKCAFFQFYEKAEGDSLCFLMSAVQEVSYYTCPESFLQRTQKKTKGSIGEAKCYAKVSEAKGFAPKKGTNVYKRCW